MIPFSAQAEELYSKQPQCAMIKNETQAKAFVSIRTDFYTKPDGKRSYYEEVLHLDPDAKREVCAKGPFLPDYKVYLVIKSFVPLFDCKTKLKGNIFIRDLPNDHGGNDIYATCKD